MLLQNCIKIPDVASEHFLPFIIPIFRTKKEKKLAKSVQAMLSKAYGARVIARIMEK